MSRKRYTFFLKETYYLLLTLQVENGKRSDRIEKVNKEWHTRIYNYKNGKSDEIKLQK